MKEGEDSPGDILLPGGTRRREEAREAKGKRAACAATPVGRFRRIEEEATVARRRGALCCSRRGRWEGQSVVRASGAMLDCRGASSSKLVKSPGVMAPGQFGPL